MFFQNPFPAEFRGSLPFEDIRFTPTYVCPPNVGRGDEQVIAWNSGPYDFSGVDADGNPAGDLVIEYAIDPNSFQNYASITIDIATAAVTSSDVSEQEVVDILNADTTFSAWFTARLERDSQSSPNQRIHVRSKMPSERIKFYVSNGRAEEKLGFNARAGVADLPDYYDRHTIVNAGNFDYSVGQLVALDPDAAGGASAVDTAIIDNAVDVRGNNLGFDSSNPKDHWELLEGRSSFFRFKKQTVDGSSRITEIIEYGAGSKVGDLARRTQMTYTGAQTEPDEIFQTPYVLTSGDLITPP